MKKFTLALIISCFAIASAHAGGIGDNSYKDSDWNTSMYNWDNDYLHGQDIEWVKYNGDQALQFTLEGGKPGIRDDDRPTRRGALFRERNELHSDYFNRDDHIIAFKFNMVEGFNGRKETFFQIHSYNSYCAMIQGQLNVFPTLKLQVHKGRIAAITKSRKGKDRKAWTRTWLPLSKNELINKISKRVDQMMKDGAIKEVKDFLKLNLKSDSNIFKVIGIREIKEFIDKKISMHDLKLNIVIKTRQYAKRQRTWSRGQMSDWQKFDAEALSKFIKKL